MKFIADFHLHSKYSRATSPKTDLENLDKWAKIKGIKVLGTGDFTHPEWFQELKEKLEPAEDGLFRLKSPSSQNYAEFTPTPNFDVGAGAKPREKETRFILTSEISCIYSKNGRVRKVHIVVFAPSLATVEKINTQLGWIGNLKADGRPILGLDAKELAKIVLNISKECLIIPAHCLLPDAYLHSNPGIKKIKDISVGDKVYTHKGRLKKVKQIYTRFYKGPIYNIKPYYFRIGLQTTPEHPFYVIKTYKNCSNFGIDKHVYCRETCNYRKKRGCPHPYFKYYKTQWVQAKDIEKQDILIFPRFNNNTKDIDSIKLSDFFKKKEYKLEEDKILLLNSRAKRIPNIIKITKEFCRLVGYYIAEGYTDNRDSVSFCFNRNERKYIKDLKFLMEEIFGLSSPRIYKRKNTNGIEIIYFSKILAKVFSKLFYNNSTIRRAHTKCLPVWMLNLPLEKQVEIFRGWWRGDTGVTSSRELMNQMKIICLRLGIIPSVYIQTEKGFNKRPSYKHKIGDRTIKAGYDSFSLRRLAFFQDLFGLLKTPEFKRFNTKLKRRHGWIDKKYIYLPVRDIEVKDYEGNVYNLEVEEDNSYLSEFATIHNCMTPWFGIFGSKSGFNSLEECFEDYTQYIYAIESGLSADPAMLWRIQDGRKVTIISNSDAHSPAKLGREANVFEGDELSYYSIINAIKNGRGRTSPNNGRSPSSPGSLSLIYTIEFYPEEGKYHYDGHRNCGISLSPSESKKYNNICPNCGKPLTIGVLNRVEELADKPEGFKPEGAIPFKSLVPLEEVIAESLGQNTGTKQVEAEYKNLIEKFGQEFKILLDISKTDLGSVTLPEIAEGITRVREGRVYVEPGYDGVFGKVRIFSKTKQKKLPNQKTLF